MEKLHESLTRNFHNGHPESILTAAVVDDNKDTREFAVEKIKWAREKRVGSEVRFVKAPKFNFHAETYLNLAPLNKPEECDPPILRDINLEDCLNNHKAVRQLLKFPCHSQANERYVQEVHKAVPHCASDQDVMGMVRVREAARYHQGNLKSKKDFQMIID